MKKVAGIIWLSLLLTVVTSTDARPQGGRNGNDGRVCVYENVSFSGWEECYRMGDEVGDMHSRSGRVSSIRVFGNATVLLFDDRNFKGVATQVNSDVRDLGQLKSGFGGMKTWNDRVVSFRVTSPNYRGPEPPPIFSRDDRRDDGRDDRRDDRYGRREPDSVCVYEDTDYRGRVECFNNGRDVADLGRQGNWSDRISSIRIMGNARAVAFLDVNYRGERLLIDQDIPDLRRLRIRDNRTWDNQISSIEVGNVGRRR